MFKFIFTLFLLFFTASCSQVDEDPYTFEEHNLRCLEGKTSGQYIVKMSDGQHIKFFASSKRDLINKLKSKKQTEIFNKLNLSVSGVDYNFRVQLKQTPPGANTPPGTGVNFGPELLNTSFMWDKGFYGEGVVIALIDSGYDVNHPFLKDAVLINHKEKGNDEDGNGFKNDVTGWDFINDAPLTKDLGSHGTSVGSVIAASHTRHIKTSMAPESKILPIAALGVEAGTPTKISGDDNSIINSIDYALSKNVDIINASWAGYLCSKFNREKIEEASNKGVFVVTSAGNEKTNLDETPIFPGSLPYPLVVTVGALDSDLNIEENSNFGSVVDFFTFGTLIPAAAPQTEGLYSRPSGTSLSAPFISGALALLKNAFPRHPPEALLDALEESKNSKKIPNLERAYRYLKNH